jgi:hypothetical protein
LEIADSRFPPVGEIFLQIMGPEVELGAGGDSLEIPAVVSEILMEIPTIISFSCVFLGAGSVLAGIDFIQQLFTGFRVTTSFRPV